MRIRVTAVFIGLVLVASACSSSSDSGEATAGTDSPATTATATQDTTAPEAATTTAAPAEESGGSGGGSGTATVTLDNGESFSFSVLCNLEPQQAAGQEILFTAVSYDEPLSFDVTKFGEGSGVAAGVIDGLGTISIYDAETYDDVWGAGSVTAQLSQSDFNLELDGTTIIGSGLFFTGEDAENLKFDAGVPGELVANCG